MGPAEHADDRESDLLGSGTGAGSAPGEGASTVVTSPAGRAAPRHPAPPPQHIRAVGREEFERALLASGLIEAAALRAFLAELPDGTAPADGAQLARELVRAGKLTKYQAAAIYQGKARGLLVGPYVLLEKLGSGGMGMVFQARHRTRGTLVALKLLPPSFARLGSAVARLQREATALARLNHPNVVTVYDVDESAGVHYLVMEYIDGVDLGRLVGARGPLPVGLAISCVAQAARGLQAAHDQGVIHRDVKPSNLLLDRSGTVKVLDLGLARIDEAAARTPPQPGAAVITQSGTYLGTMDFLAPEQADDPKRVDARADLYSLGCTLYYLLTGHPPYEGGTMLAQLVAHREQPVPSLRAARPDVPECLDAIFRRMVAKAPADRQGSLGEAADALEACRAAREPVPGPPASPAVGAAELHRSDLEIEVRSDPEQPALTGTVWDRRRRLNAVLIVSAAAAVVVLAGLLVARLAFIPPRPEPAERPMSHPNGSPAATAEPASEPSAVGAPRPRPPVAPGESRVLAVLAGPVLGVAVSPDGHQALTAGEDGTVRLWDLDTGAEARRFEGHHGAVLDVAVSPNGSQGLSAGRDGLAIVWDLETGQEALRLQGHDGPVNAVAFAPDGSRALSGGADHTVRLWDLETGRELARLSGHDQPVSSVAFSPDDRVAISGGERTMRLWDLQTRRQLHQFDEHQGKIWSVAFSADGRRALSASADGYVRLWDVKQGHMTLRLDDHQTPVRCVAFSPDGQRAASGDEGGGLTLWDLTTGRPQRQFKLPGVAVTGLAFTPDGRRVLSVGDDGRLRLWKLPEADRPGLPSASVRERTPGRRMVLYDADPAAFARWLRRMQTSHYRPVAVAGYGAEGVPQLAAVALRDRSRIAWEVHLDDSLDALRKTAEAAPPGHSALALSSYPIGRETGFVSLWAEHPGAGALLTDLASAQLVETMKTLHQEHRLPVALTAYPAPGGLQFAAAVHPDGGRGWQGAVDLTSGQLRACLAENRSKGFRPLTLAAYRATAGTRFAAVLVRDPQPQPWEERHDLSAAELDEELEELAARGFLPRLIGGYDEDGARQYLAIWSRGTPESSP